MPPKSSQSLTANRLSPGSLVKPDGAAGEAPSPNK